MVAGAATIARARTAVERERVVTRRDDSADPAAPHTVEEVVRERDTGPKDSGY